MKILAEVFFNNEDQIVWHKTDCLWGLEPLIKSYKTVKLFFPLQNEDFILLNDPQCGGLFPFALTVIRRYQTGTLVQLRQCLFELQISDHIDQESFRIPPTPIVAQGQLQTEILNSLAQHPKSPARLDEKIKQIFTELSNRPLDLLNISWPSLSKPSPEIIQQFLDELPHWNSSNEIKLSTGETLKLNVEISEKKIVCDFTGTTVGQKVFLNEAVVSGLCHEYIFQILQAPEQLRLWISEFVIIKQPQNSLLNLKYPQPQARGLIIGTAAILHALQNCFCVGKNKSPVHSFFSTFVQVNHDREFYQYWLPPGVHFSQDIQPQLSNQNEPCSAHFSAYGLDGISKAPRLQELEIFFSVEKYEKQNSSQGGLQLEMTARKNIKMIWFTEAVQCSLNTKSTKSPSHELSQLICNSGEIIVDKCPLSLFGEIQIKKGQKAVWSSGARKPSRTHE